MTSPRSEAASDRRRSRQFSDASAAALAVAVWAGASAPASRPVVLLVVVGIVAAALRRPLLLVLLCGLLAQGMAQRAEAGMQVQTGDRVDGRLTLLTDPRPDDLGLEWRAEVSFADRRWQLVASDELVSLAFTEALAGERVDVEGTTARLRWGSDWLRARHVVGSINVSRVGEVHAGTVVHRFANEIRRRLTDGAASLGPRRQALFVGFVLGDDRFQDPVDAASFRRAGLTHLLAVSGQNVAFVLALLAPALHRLRLGGRLALTLGVIALFALITRFEPSVLRASVMAAVAATAVTMGREASSTRVLALTVSMLVLIDPFLVSSVGFRLSVAASGGILVLSAPIARRIRGPRPFALALAVTAGAQLGVAPLLLTTFGPVPIASVPANLLAGPASGPVMMWGMSAGLVAGFVPTLAPAVHGLTGLLLGWIEWVARGVPELLRGGIGATRLAVIVALILVLALTARRGHLVRSGLIAALLVATFLPEQGHPVVWAAQPTAGVTVWVGSDGATVVAVDGRSRPERALLALSDLRVGDIDLVVGRSSSPAVRVTIEAVVLDRGARAVIEPGSAAGLLDGRVGCLDVSLDAGSDSVDVEVVHVVDGGCVPPSEIASPDAAGARASPL